MTLKKLSRFILSLAIAVGLHTTVMASDGSNHSSSNIAHNDHNNPRFRTGITGGTGSDWYVERKQQETANKEEAQRKAEDKARREAEEAARQQRSSAAAQSSSSAASDSSSGRYSSSYYPNGSTFEGATETLSSTASGATQALATAAGATGNAALAAGKFTLTHAPSILAGGAMAYDMYNRLSRRREDIFSDEAPDSIKEEKERYRVITSSQSIFYAVDPIKDIFTRCSEYTPFQVSESDKNKIKQDIAGCCISIEPSEKMDSREYYKVKGKINIFSEI